MPKTIINYDNTIIYKIVCNNLNITDCYVGHTTNFIKRKQRHKDACNNPNKKNNIKLYLTIRENGGWNNWVMIEIEKYSCDNRNEATARERYWYEHLFGNLNGNVPGRTRKEYEQVYYELNKEKCYESCKLQKEKRTLPYECECGMTFQHCNKARHFKGIKHKQYLESI